jgi:hypothetical protein
MADQGMPFICLACHSILRQKTVDFWQAGKFQICSVYHWHIYNSDIYDSNFTWVYGRYTYTFHSGWWLYQWPFQEPKLEVPTISKAYVRAM